MNDNWGALQPTCDDLARLVTTRQINARDLSAGALAYVVAMMCIATTGAEFGAAVDADPEVCALKTQLQGILTANGANPRNPWPTGEGTDEFERLRVVCDARIDAIQAQIFASVGEDVLAEVVAHGRLILLLKNSAQVFARECLAVKE